VRASAPALVTAGVTVLFLLVAAWWPASDERIPDFDSGKHMLFALQFNSAWAEGDLLAPFTDFTAYPPLVHIVGALGLRIIPSP
jgi:hypothetical protein